MNVHEKMSELRREMREGLQKVIDKAQAEWGGGRGLGVEVFFFLFRGAEGKIRKDSKD